MGILRRVPISPSDPLRDGATVGERIEAVRRHAELGAPTSAPIPQAWDKRGDWEWGDWDKNIGNFEDWEKWDNIIDR